MCVYVLVVMEVAAAMHCIDEEEEEEEEEEINTKQRAKEEEEEENEDGVRIGVPVIHSGKKKRKKRAVKEAGKKEKREEEKEGDEKRAKWKDMDMDMDMEREKQDGRMKERGKVKTAEKVSTHVLRGMELAQELALEKDKQPRRMRGVGKCEREITVVFDACVMYRDEGPAMIERLRDKKIRYRIANDSGGHVEAGKGGGGGAHACDVGVLVRWVWHDAIEYGDVHAADARMERQEEESVPFAVLVLNKEETLALNKEMIESLVVSCSQRTAPGCTLDLILIGGDDASLRAAERREFSSSSSAAAGGGFRIAHLKSCLVWAMVNYNVNHYAEPEKTSAAEQLYQMTRTFAQMPYQQEETRLSAFGAGIKQSSSVRGRTTWERMLNVIPGVSQRLATTIAGIFRTPAEMVDAMEQDGAEDRLAAAEDEDGRRVGNACASKLHAFFTAD